MILRRRGTPEAVRAVSLDERRLAWGLTDDGVALVATASALHIGEQVLPWTSVERVSWQPPVLHLWESAEVEGAGAQRSWSLAEDARLAELVRSRVTSSVGWSDRRKLPTGGHVRLVGRRTPGVDALQWQTVWEREADREDPLVRAQVDVWVAELRASLG